MENLINSLTILFAGGSLNNNTLEFNIPKEEPVSSWSDIFNPANQGANTGLVIVQIITGLLLVGAMINSMLHIYQISKNANNPSKRAEYVKGLGFSLLAVAIIGGASYLTLTAVRIFG